jgi:hypothetical protein
MKKLITSLANTILSVFNFYETWTKRKEKKAVEKQRQKVIDRINEARKGVAEGDEETINRLIEEKRQQKSVSESGHIECFVLFSMMLILGSIFALSGCITRTKTIVVPADRQVVRMEMGNVKGWFVPDATMADLMETYVKTQKTENPTAGWEEPVHWQNYDKRFDKAGMEAQ